MRFPLLAGLLIFAVAAGCVENEQSFYIEHMKSPPDPPECTTSIGDPTTPGLSVNLMIANNPGNYFQATNALISREDYGNLRAESNGITVEGYELYTTVPGMGIVGGTEYFEYNFYLAPETSDLIYATVMTSEATSFLRNYYHCEYYSPQQVANAIYYNKLREALLARDDQVPANINQQAANGQTLLGNLVAMDAIPEIMYSNVRFLGHSQGNKDVETPEFTVVLYPTCGAVGGWEPCINDVCMAFCNDEASYPETCAAGINAPMSCSDYLAGITYTIPYEETDPLTNQTETLYQDICDYFNCP